ncbi:MAG TPA: hypothetical protein VEU30_00855 [Thermoanaerobaculia bacterium]|nr:hypothetical protein [Thermoanaerobaculia bacterium]
MADHLSVGFSNKAREVWTIGIYQTLSGSTGLDSALWKESVAPHQGTTNIGWTVRYNVVVADFFAFGPTGMYSSTQVLATAPGKQWKVEMDGWERQLFDDGPAAEPNQIVIRNVSAHMANVGIGMDNVGSVYKRNLPSGADAQFTVSPTYWAALFKMPTTGELIASTVTTEPLILSFEGGSTRIELEAWLVGETLHFGVPSTGQIVSTPMDVVRARVADQQQLAADRLQLKATPSA